MRICPISQVKFSRRYMQARSAPCGPLRKSQTSVQTQYSDSLAAGPWALGTSQTRPTRPLHRINRLNFWHYLFCKPSSPRIPDVRSFAISIIGFFLTGAAGISESLITYLSVYRPITRSRRTGSVDVGWPRRRWSPRRSATSQAPLQVGWHTRLSGGSLHPE